MYVNTLGVWGGVATYLIPLISDQVKKGNSVSLVVGNEGELVDDVRQNFPSVKIIIVDTMKRNVDIKGIVKSIFRFRKIVKNERPDIIHFNCIMSGLIGRLGTIFLKTKKVYNAHGWAFEPGTDKKFQLPAIIVEKFMAYLTDKIICVSDYEKAIADKYHVFKNSNQAVVIKNGSEDFSKETSVCNNDDEFIMTMAARFWAQKNQMLLLKSLKYLIDNYKLDKTLHLYLLGDGPLLKECQEYAKNNSLTDFVTFTGIVNNVNDYYSKSDVVLLITNYDAIAISLIEALSMGKPIIASNVCGVPENFSDKLNGYCVDNDEKQIADAMYKMINNDSLRKEMGVNSRELYLSDFKIDHNLKLHDSLYHSLLNK